MSRFPELQPLGWQTFYSRQLTGADVDACYPARVAAVHRSVLRALAAHGSVDLVIPSELRRGRVGAELTVGDWVLVERAAPRIRRPLARASAIVRVAPGGAGRPQAIAANLDTLFVVTSCNDDLNPARLERYLAVALDARVQPVIVLTRADLCAAPDDYLRRAADAAPGCDVLALNATSPEQAAWLSPWLGAGRTVAFVGSSGVGKTTLVNALTGDTGRVTAPIREDDSRGRHTTTARELVPMSGGAWLIDTPGMRELAIGAVGDGLDRAFPEIAGFAENCRFRDCRHDGDAGCAVAAAVADGQVDARRVASWKKLGREAAHAAQTEYERRDSERTLGKVYRSAQSRRRRERGR